MVREIRGELKEQWGLGRILATCCGVIYGERFDVEDNEVKLIFLGSNYNQALRRVHFVKAFIY